MTICVGRDHWARRPPGLFRHFASVGEGLAPPAGFVPHRLLWGNFAAPAASPFWSDPKGAKRSPGDGSGEHQMVLLVARPPDPRYEESLIRGLGGNVPARGGL